jgi:hypothetical protein
VDFPFGDELLEFFKITGSFLPDAMLPDPVFVTIKTLDNYWFPVSA